MFSELRVIKLSDNDLLHFDAIFQSSLDLCDYVHNLKIACNMFTMALVQSVPHHIRSTN